MIHKYVASNHLIGTHYPWFSSLMSCYKNYTYQWEFLFIWITSNVQQTSSNKHWQKWHLDFTKQKLKTRWHETKAYHCYIIQKFNSNLSLHVHSKGRREPVRILHLSVISNYDRVKCKQTSLIAKYDITWFFKLKKCVNDLLEIRQLYVMKL